MNIRTHPDTLTQLIALNDVTTFEPAGDQPAAEKTSAGRFQSRSLADCITQVSTPRGPKPVLKAMLTTACERDCFYCPFRAGRSRMQRATFAPNALADAFDTLQRAKQVDGLFLSSGIVKGSVTTQDKLIDTVEIVRRSGYRGYVHLKIMPGIQHAQLYRAMQLADRISVNLEGATQTHLDQLAPKKEYTRELMQMLQWANDLRRQHPEQKLASTVTQFVVGAVGESDVDLLSVSRGLYRQLKLQRVYYSAFHPVRQTPFENLPAEDPLRQHRLYQASFLLRDYDWELEDLPFTPQGHLPLNLDPKRAYAEQHFSHTPLELNTATREQLMRLPGVGPKTAAAILHARRQSRLRDLSQLRALGLRSPAATTPYILLAGRAPARQLALF